MIKKFSKTLFKKYDTAAKEAVAEIFKDMKSYSIVPNEKKYGVDFLIYKKKEHIGYLEVEVKTVWKEEAFPYSDVNWPERKAKYAKLDKPTIFLIFSKYLEQYLTTTSKCFLKADKEIVRNKYIPYGEYFYKVPLKNVNFNAIKKDLKNIQEEL
jgi:hypothetical protein